MIAKTPEELNNYKISDIETLNYECQAIYEVTTDFYEAEVTVVSLGKFNPIDHWEKVDPTCSQNASNMVLFVHEMVKRVAKLAFEGVCKPFAEDKLKNWMNTRVELLGMDILVHIRTLSEYAPGNVENPQNAIDIYRERTNQEPSSPENFIFTPPKVSMTFKEVCDP